MKKLFGILFLCWFVSNLNGQESQNIQYSDGILHYEIYGQGEPLLIINGGPGMNSLGFRALAKAFSESHQAIIYDQRGTGQSLIPSIDEKTIHIDAMVEDIEVLRKHLGIKKWHVLGHSFGGMLASYYATKYPESIQSMILSASGGINLDLYNKIDIQGRLSETERDSLAYWTREIAQGDTSYYARLKRGQFLAPAYLYDKSFVPTIAERLTQGNRLINGLVFQSMNSIQFDCTEGLRNFQAPVLIIQGKNDILDTSLSSYADEILPNSSLILLDQCGHYGWLDREEAYFDAIYSFLDQVKSR